MSERISLKVWITKYALSQGIFELCAQTSSIDGLISDSSNSLRIYHGEGREWHRTKECAVIKADRCASIKSNLSRSKSPNSEN